MEGIHANANTVTWHLPIILQGTKILLRYGASSDVYQLSSRVSGFPRLVGVKCSWDPGSRLVC